LLAVDNVEHELSGLLPLVEEDGWKWIVAQNAFYQLPSVSFGPDRFALEARGELKMALIVIIARAWDIPPSIQNILKEGFEDSDPPL
jgi:hypothetical protein